MAIVGLTVTEKGEAIQRLAVATKVSIGEVVKTANGTRPNKLDHFTFLRKSTKSSDWEPDPELAKQYGVECRDLEIILISDELENVFRTEYAWWKATEKKCWGDGRNATRRTPEHPEGEPWQGCGEGCPDLQKSGCCKPNGDLYFVLAERPKLGSVCRLHTTSYQSIRQLYSALEQIRTITGGRLAGIKCTLTVRPSRTAYQDDKGAKKTTTVYTLNIEISATGMHKLIGEMTQHAQLFQQTRKLLSDGRRVEYVADEDEVVKAREIAEEFNPPEETPAPVPVQPMPQRKSETNGNGAHVPVNPEVLPKTDAAPGIITREQRRLFYDTCMEAGWGPNQVSEILLSKWGIKSSAEIPADKFDDILSRFKSGQIDDPEPEAPAAPYQATDEDIPF